MCSSRRVYDLFLPFGLRGGWEFQNPPARLIFRERPGKGTGLAGALCELFKLNTQAAGALC